jgi:hypothetical protein
MRRFVTLRSLLIALVLGVLALGYSACSDSYDAPSSPGMVGTPPPGATPTPPRY